MPHSLLKASRSSLQDLYHEQCDQSCVPVAVRHISLVKPEERAAAAAAGGGSTEPRGSYAPCYGMLL
jgi:hypothetical protein